MPDLSNAEAGAQALSGYLYLDDSVADDLPGSRWYFFGEYPDGNWMIQLNKPPVEWLWV